MSGRAMDLSMRASPWRGLGTDALWQLIERATRIGLGFLLSIVVARSLGPSKFGIYSYALSVIAIFAFLGQAGLDSLLLRELVRKPERASTTLSEGLILRLGGSLLAGLASVATVLLATSEELRPSVPLVAIMTLSGLLQSAWVIENWLQTRHLFAPAAIAKIVAYIAAATLRMGALFLPEPLIALAAIAVIESLLCTLLLWRAAKRHTGLGPSALRWPDGRNVRDMAWMAAPMLASAFTIAIYSRIDVLMLGHMLGTQAAGLYTAGSLLSEGFYFLPSALMAAAAPRLAHLFNEDRAAFAHGLSSILRALSATGLVIAIAITCAAPFLVSLLFGNDYRVATGVLQIHIWSTWVVFISAASDAWYINYDLRRLYLIKTTLSAALNIVLNLIMIPRWQVEGAAWATLVAYTTSAIVTGLLWPQTRPLLHMQLRAILGLRSRLTSREAT